MRLVSIIALCFLLAPAANAGQWVAGHMPVIVGQDKIDDSGIPLPVGPFADTDAVQTFRNKTIDCSLNNCTNLQYSSLPVGTSTGTVAAGDDSRITGAAQKASNLSDLASSAAGRANLNSVHATVTSNTSIDGTARLWPCDASAGAVTLTLPAGSGVPNYFWDVKKIDISANACTIAMSGGDTLDGNASIAIRFQNDDLTIQNNAGGSTWYIR